MGRAESHPSGSVRDDDGSVAAIVNDESASKRSALLGARHTVDEPLNPAVARPFSYGSHSSSGNGSGMLRHSHSSVSVSCHYSKIVRIRMQSQYG